MPGSPIDQEKTFEHILSPTPIGDNGDRGEPLEEIILALESLSLASLRMRATGRLPLLLRTLRRGFMHRCKLLGVPTAPCPLNGVIEVVYQRGDACSSERVTSWKCPVCELHRAFLNRDMLQKHMTWDHQEVDVLWEETNEVQLSLV